MSWNPSLADDQKRDKSLDGEVGITTASVSQHLSQQEPGKFKLLDLPRIMRDELDMKVIDLNTSVFPSFDPESLDQFRKAAEKAGCVLTNLKMNQRNLDLGSPDRTVRDKAVAEYKRSIDAAARLGVRWVRPLPRQNPPNRNALITGFRELADYAALRKIQVLIENYGWLESDPDSIVKLIEAVDRNLAASPDTANWSNEEIRYQGLERSFPSAVTCDFKPLRLGPDGEHTAYDLKRCFTIGWDAGFRGPWCLEHANRDAAQLFRELRWLRDQLRQWIAERSKA
jgi:hypothetical protein